MWHNAEDVLRRAMSIDAPPAPLHAIRLRASENLAHAWSKRCFTIALVMATAGAFLAGNVHSSASPMATLAFANPRIPSPLQVNDSETKTHLTRDRTLNPDPKPAPRPKFS